MSAPRIVIVGGGFGGLNAALTLARHPVSVVLIDRKNHHTFQPLLYQVATAGLSPGEIAAPIRGILRKSRNVAVVLAEVTGVDVELRLVHTSAGADVSCDYLVVAAGATHSYFGNDQWAPLAPGLKTIEDALEIRRRVLLAFEIAEREAIATGTHPPLNFVIVGAGPTGVELAGTLAEISRRSLASDFRAIDPRKARVILVEAMSRVLLAYPEDLSESARRQLEKLGVEVRLNTRVTAIEPGQLRLGDTVLPAAVTLWAAGVAASPLGKMMAPTDSYGRVIVEPDLSIPGHPNVFVIGDMAASKGDDGKPLPGVAPVALQQGTAVGRNILRDLRGKPRKPFVYLNKGTLATIGRAAAVADLGRLHVSGFVAWLLWIFIHILYLVGFRNRLLVLVEWAWAYVTYQRSARLITGRTDLPGFDSK
jgi:NADH:ubiquinone reductase (H+-translocating)